jgi:hypothetical protein
MRMLWASAKPGAFLNRIGYIWTSGDAKVRQHANNRTIIPRVLMRMKTTVGHNFLYESRLNHFQCPIGMPLDVNTQEGSNISIDSDDELFL